MSEFDYEKSGIALGTMTQAILTTRKASRHKRLEPVSKPGWIRGRMKKVAFVSHQGSAAAETPAASAGRLKVLKLALVLSPDRAGIRGDFIVEFCHPRVESLDDCGIAFGQVGRFANVVGKVE